MRVSVDKEANPSGREGRAGRDEGASEMRRERMVSFRATSDPERSSAG